MSDADHGDGAPHDHGVTDAPADSDLQDVDLSAADQPFQSHSDYTEAPQQHHHEEVSQHHHYHEEPPAFATPAEPAHHHAAHDAYSAEAATVAAGAEAVATEAQNVSRDVPPSTTAVETQPAQPVEYHHQQPEHVYPPQPYEVPAPQPTPVYSEPAFAAQPAASPAVYTEQYAYTQPAAHQPQPQAPEPVAVPTQTSTVPAGVRPPPAASANLFGDDGTGDGFFEFKTVTRVQKVHKSGGLDYWVYYVVLETDSSHYLQTQPGQQAAAAAAQAGNANADEAGSSQSRAVTLTQSRRYKEFEWLRESLAVENPGVIIPPLPGLLLAGMLDKVDGILGPGESEEVAALVTYRMRGLTLFLKYVAKSPVLRRSVLVHKFMTLTHEDLTKYRSTEWKDWKKKLESATSERTSIVFKFKKNFTAPRALDPFITQVRGMMNQSIHELSTLQTNLEALWDQIVNLCEKYVPEQLEQMKFTDPVLNALAKTSAQISTAIHHFSEPNEELFLNLVVDLSFAHGLCKSVREVTDHLEAVSLLSEQRKQEGKSEEIERELNAAIATLREDWRRFHNLKRPLLKRLASNMARLCSSLDPVFFDWQGRCAGIVASIPDPEGWSTE